jgi:prevent-host-death family protein
MTTVKISEFKAKCLEILDRVARTGETLVITRRGKPLARVLPVSTAPDGDWMGSMKGSAEAADDLIEPVVDPEEWEALAE